MSARIELRTRSHHTPTSPTLERAAKAATTYGLTTRHRTATDPHNHHITRHQLIISGDTSILHMLVPELRRIGFRPNIHT